MSGTIDSEGYLLVGGKDSYRMKFSSLLTYAAKGKDFLLIGDNNHSNAQAIMTAISKESIATMKALGVKHLCLEFPKQVQNDVDAYFAGKVTHKQIEDAYTKRSRGRAWLSEADNRLLNARIPEMLREAKAAGIKVHYIDDNTPEQVATEQPIMTLIWRKSISMPGAEREAFLKSLEKEKPDIIPAYMAYVATMLEQRDGKDKDLAAQIKPMAADGKVAVVYGGAHYEKSQDLNEYLGVNRSVVIALERSWHPNELSREPSRGDDLPHFVYFTDFPEDSGKRTQRGAKIQANHERSDACKMAVKTGAPTFLAGCTVADAELEDFTAAKTPNLRPKQKKVNPYN